MTATSDGRNGNDGCQGYGIKANALEIGGGGTVRAYSNGYSTKTNRYDGKEAIYVSSNLTVDLGGYLYAKTQNPMLSNENENGALKVNGRWDLSGTNGDTAYTKAVITKPVNGSIYKNVILETTVSPEKEPAKMNKHNGHEFDYVLQGSLKCKIGEKEIILEEGDSIYFDSVYPHGIQSNTDQPAKFLAIVLE